MIAERVDRILEERHRRLEPVRQRIEHLNGILMELEHFEGLKNEIVDEQGGFRESSKYHGLGKENPEMLEKVKGITTYSLREKIKAAIKAYEAIQERFSRDNINIAVVGEARQGKSKLLQMVSGLNDYVIPALMAGDCTGATSVVRNVKGQALTARITFRTEAEMVSIVQQYLQVILGAANAPIIRRMDEIRTLNLADIQEKMGVGSPHSLKFAHLKKYVENYSTWSAHIGVGQVQYQDEKQIMRFVAQHNGKQESDPQRENYFNYLSVKDVEISCSFPFADAGSVVLIDTIGIGDTSLGIEDAMLSAIDKQSDAAIVVKRPEASTGKMTSSDERIYHLLHEKFAHRDMEKWLFWLLNNTTRAPFGDNTERCLAISSQMKDQRWSLADQRTIDFLDENSVREGFLIPLLDTLTRNLGPIDQGLIKRTYQVAEEAYREYTAFFHQMERVISGEFKGSVRGRKLYNKEFKAVHGHGLLGNLKAFCSRLRSSRNDPCEGLAEEVSRTVTNIDQYLPTLDEVVKELSAGGHYPIDVYNGRVNRIRTSLTEAFIAIDRFLEPLVARFKNEITELLIGAQTGRLSFVRKPPVDAPVFEWLHVFREETLSEEDFPQLRLAFAFLIDFDISVRGFLMHKVRKHLDLLDPHFAEGQVKIDGSTDEEQAKSICFELRVRVTRVRDLLCRELEGFFKDPNEVFFAVGKEFLDRVSFSPGVEEEWQVLYDMYATRIWQEEFEQLEGIGVAFKDWRAMIDRFKVFASEEYFVV